MEPDHAILQQTGQSSESGRTGARERGGVAGWRKPMRPSRGSAGSGGVREQGQLASSSSREDPSCGLCRRRILFLRN